MTEDILLCPPAGFLYALPEETLAFAGFQQPKTESSEISLGFECHINVKCTFPLCEIISLSTGSR